jgi:hypothetical protein
MVSLLLQQLSLLPILPLLLLLLLLLVLPPPLLLLLLLQHHTHLVDCADVHTTLESVCECAQPTASCINLTLQHNLGEWEGGRARGVGGRG